MNKKFILWSIIILILIVLIIMFFSTYSYKMSPNILRITENSVTNGVLKLKIENNNQKGYFKEIKVVKKGTTTYVYVIGTGFKVFRNKDTKNIHYVSININDVEKVYIKGQNEKILVYEFKGI